MTPSLIPVVTIDGPSGSGKGALTALLAKWTGFHVLDSGRFIDWWDWRLARHRYR